MWERLKKRLFDKPLIMTDQRINQSIWQERRNQHLFTARDIEYMSKVKRRMMEGLSRHELAPLITRAAPHLVAIKKRA